MNKIEPRTLPGFMELLPKEQILFNQMKEKIQKSYEKFGFLPIDTPIIEMADVLLAKAGGETEKQIYRFQKGENDLTLRFDLTVPLAKYVTEYYNDLSFPFRRYQIGKVYRGERPQKGRFREFYQCDIDIIGDGELSIINDAEMPSVIYNTIKELGFEDFTICMNNRKLLTGLFEELELQNESVEVMRIIDKLDKIGKENVIACIKDLGIEDKKIDTIIKFIEIDGTTDEKLQKVEDLNISTETFKTGLEELKQVVNYVRNFGVPDNNFKVDFTIARGLDYYTGTVYETFLNEYREIGSVCSGGRYDNLAEYYTDKKLPGVGISIGFTRLFYKLNELQAIKEENKSISKVLVISMIEDKSKAIEVATILRKNNIPTEVYLEEKKIKAKFKYADKLLIPYVIVIGEDEIANNVVTLKNMQTGEQETLKLEDVINKIK
ncbi:MAG: histidine--tRNA ligase [Clostridiaceae bacterium]|nr:histidine--tRNA ligase [Clostridiaceae bacterium]